MKTTEKYFMTSKELNKAYLGVSEVKLYEILNRPGCPKVNVGRKYLIPVKKFLEWLENEACENDNNVAHIKFGE